MGDLGKCALGRHDGHLGEADFQIAQLCQHITRRDGALGSGWSYGSWQMLNRSGE